MCSHHLLNSCFLFTIGCYKGPHSTKIYFHSRTGLITNPLSVVTSYYNQPSQLLSERCLHVAMSIYMCACHYSVFQLQLASLFLVCFHTQYKADSYTYCLKLLHVIFFKISKGFGIIIQLDLCEAFHRYL